jgi:very-short-patch-repair endonuclease
MAAIAAGQHGVISAAQLYALGFTEQAIWRRVQTKRLHRLHRGVYAVGHIALTAHSHYLAAVLACGPGALASHRTAAVLHGLLRSTTKIEVTAPRGRGRHEGIRVHRSRLIAAEDRALIDGIPTTSAARTLVDLADVLDERRLADAVHRAEILRIFDLSPLQATLARLPGRAGRHKLRRVLAAYEPERDENPLQERFLDLCRRAGLPAPRREVQIGGHTVDFLWPDVNLAIETDGAATHHTRRAFHENRKRDRALAARGIRVARLTAPDFNDPVQLVAELEAIRGGC